MFEGLVGVFEHIGGVAQRIGFDNASTMVVKVLKNGGYTLTTNSCIFRLIGVLPQLWLIISPKSSTI